MQYEKQIKDQFNDAATVSVGVNSNPDGDVLLGFPAGVCGNEMMYTPAQARRLARALKQAANVAEGKPAKAKRHVIDGDGDTWNLRSDGFYECPSEPHLRPISLEAIREEWGITGEERP